MKLLNFIRQVNTKLLMLTVFILLPSAITFSQIRINGIKILEANVPNNKEKQRPEAKSESAAKNKQTNSKTEDFAQIGQDDEKAKIAERFVYDINEAKGDVDIWEVEGRAYFVRSTHQKWLLLAVSQKARKTFAIEKKINDWRLANPGNKFDSALDSLAASAAKKLPLYVPHSNNFAIRDAKLEMMMMGKLKNAATAKIIKIGIFHANWLIEKNSLGIPDNRYREGYVWAKDSTDDHSYCHLYGFVIQQDYSGGGSYGATHVYLNTDTLFGCPAQ